MFVISSIGYISKTISEQKWQNDDMIIVSQINAGYTFWSLVQTKKTDDKFYHCLNIYSSRLQDGTFSLSYNQRHFT